ncbi:MAG: UvrB/UvrC motif-containing protein [Treponema sp.]|nr:UvrB/UvrC motif-containing protein [Treponema sp.]
MICDICGVRDATMVVQQVSVTGRKEVHLCLQCAAQRGLSTSNGKIEMSLAGLFDSIAKLQKNQRQCPVCGKSEGELERNQRLGCPECYNFFGPKLKSILEKRGVTGSYTGSLPERLASYKSVLADRMQLKEKLEQSIAQEEYEKAALYRDRLKALDKCVAGSDCSDSLSQGECCL